MNNNNKLKVFSGRANVPLAEKIAQCLGDPLGKLSSKFPRRRIPGPHRRGHARPRRVCGAADLLSGQRQHHGAADHPRQPAAGQCRPHHRRHALLRLRPPGPQGPGPRAASPPSWWPTCSPGPGSIASWPSTCTPPRFRAFSTSPSTTCTPGRSSTSTFAV